MRSIRMVVGLGVVFGALAMSGASALANTTIDTTASQNATLCCYGPPGVATPTYGQTITAPASDTRLTDFSFVLLLPSDIVFRGAVYAWDGSQATGPALWQSGPMSTTSASQQLVTFNIPGGVHLVSGQQYVLLATTLFDPSQTATDYGNWGVVTDGSVYPGGGAVYTNNQSSLTAPWDGAYLAGFYDMAFVAHFTPNGAATSTAVSCSPVSARVGGSSTCTATVTSHAPHPSGTVSFSSDSGAFTPTSCTLVQLGGNVARCSVSYSPSASGPHTITASYSGDSTSAASSNTTTLTATAAQSSTAVSCTPPSTSVGVASTCTATVTGQGPTGTIAWSRNQSGTFSSTSCTLTPIDATHASCQVTYTPGYVGTGQHKIYATYSGDTNNTTSSGNTTITVS